MGRPSPAQHVRRLVRRRDRLAERIGSRSGGPDDWDRGEHAALEWALPILMRHSPAFASQVRTPTSLRPVDAAQEGEPEGACPEDPDGLHHVGCGCS